METFTLPKDFLLGTATAGLQIEGGDTNNSWYRWCEQKKIKDNSHCIVSNDHWNRVDEDINLMKDLKCEIYRLSIEWSRIEPKRGEFDRNAMEHYRDEIKKLRLANITPLVTLHHFSNPIWFEDIGAFLDDESVNLFERYTDYVVRNLGDLVNEWVTINEPNVYLHGGYVNGIWPPGVKGNKLYYKAAKNIICSHIKSYKKIHETRLNLNKNDTMVGVAFHLRIFDPKGGFLDKIVSGLSDRLFHEIFISGMTEGKLISPVGSGYPYGKGKYFDFFGINYYTRDLVSFTFNGLVKTEYKNDSQKNDLGWEIYPEGIYRLCKKYFERFKMPIYITENGIADRNDDKRIEFIYNHLYYIKKLINEGVDIRKYYHWTFIDNFEWIEGYEAKFGLISFDINTQKRTVKNSGYFYKEIIENKGVIDAMLKKYNLD